MIAPVLPPRLERGSLVALTAPASPVTPEGRRAGIRALEWLGFTVEAGQSLRRNENGYAAGCPRERAEELNRAFADPAVRAIWCARGGYTAAQVLPWLDYGLIARNPKPFIGYSDITAFHTAFQQRCGFVTWHGPMACSDLAEHPVSGTLNSLRSALALEAELDYNNPNGAPLCVIRPGVGEGVLTGGNLSVLASLLGTPWAVETKGKILFLEDVGEPVPVLERLLWQLHAAGILEGAAGILLGSFADCKNRYCPEYDPMALFRHFFRTFPGPVIGGLRCGHCVPTATLPLGCLCRVEDDHICFCYSKTA